MIKKRSCKKKYKKNFKNKVSLKALTSRALRLFIVLPMTIMLVMSSITFSNADSVTDTLSIKVGYSGMDLSEYVEVDTYHWSELASALPLHKVAYSYFQSKSKNEYNAIVDSANGFYISDLLDYAGIYTGDVQSLKFYVEDHKGIQAAFDKSSLFANRYYYENLPKYRTIVYGTKTVTKEVTETVHHDAEYEVDEDGNYVLDENGDKIISKEAYDEEVTKTVQEEETDYSKIVEYNFDKAKSHGTSVQPMLALEDNWAQYSQEYENIGSDFSSMNAGNRFRLLFGQTSPTETLTSSSAKYVSCVYITLDGKPTVKDMGELNGKYGSHEVTMTVSADNINIRNALSELMNINSTNTDVLVITGIEVTPDARYSDLATVKVKYDIVGEGEASITAGVGTNSEPIAVSESVTGEGNPKDNTKKNQDKDETISDTQNSNKNSDNASSNDSALDNQDKGQEVKEKTTASTTLFELSDEAAEALNNAKMSKTETAATEDVTQVVVQEKDDDEEHRIMLLTGLGCLVLCGGGGIAETISFKLRLKKRG